MGAYPSGKFAAPRRNPPYAKTDIIAKIAYGRI